jgi:hypothetical protein
MFRSSKRASQKSLYDKLQFICIHLLIPHLLLEYQGITQVFKFLCFGFIQVRNYAIRVQNSH